MNSSDNKTKMPCLFIAHGTPMNALENNRWTKDWQSLSANIPRPKAIVIVSAHWCSNQLEISSALQPETIHDFFGFPAALFAEQYRCPGSPELANKIALILDSYRTNLNKSYGLDHGAWTVLKHLFPEADIPCLQISLDLNRSMNQHYQIAQHLKPLRDEGVLFIGSGNIVHNIPRWMNNPSGDISWAREFDFAVMNRIENNDHHAILNYLSLSNEASEAVPHPDHFLPLIYMLGLSDRSDIITYSANLNHELLEDCCMRSIRFGL